MRRCSNRTLTTWLASRATRGTRCCRRRWCSLPRATASTRPRCTRRNASEPAPSSAKLLLPPPLRPCRRGETAAHSCARTDACSRESGGISEREASLIKRGKKAGLRRGPQTADGAQVRDIAGHKFVTTSYSQPTFCAVCKSLIWGVMKQGWSCLGAAAARIRTLTWRRLRHEHSQGERRAGRAHLLREGGGLHQSARQGVSRARRPAAAHVGAQSSTKTSFFKRKVSSKEKVVKDKSGTRRHRSRPLGPRAPQTPCPCRRSSRWTSRRVRGTACLHEISYCCRAAVDGDNSRSYDTRPMHMTSSRPHCRRKGSGSPTGSFTSDINRSFSFNDDAHSIGGDDVVRSRAVCTAVQCYLAQHCAAVDCGDDVRPDQAEPVCCPRA